MIDKMNFIKQGYALIKHDPDLKKLLWLALAIKIFLLLIIVVAYNFLPFCISCHNANFYYPSNESLSLASAFKTWDGYHYIFIAENGYQKADLMSPALFPLFPFLMRCFRFLFFGHTAPAAIFLSNIFSVIGLIFFYLFTRGLFNEKIAYYSSLFLLSFPTGYYLSLIYSEALFLMLACIFFYFLYRNNFWFVFISAYLITLTRPQGIFITVPLAVFLLLKIIKEKKIRLTREFWLIVAFIGGWLTYFGIIGHCQNDFFAFFNINYRVAGNSLSNLWHPLNWFLRNFIHNSSIVNNYWNSTIDHIFFFFFLILLYFIYKRLDKTLFFYTIVTGLVPALMGNFMSYTRYLMLVFPIYMILGLKLKEKHYFLTIPMFCLQAILLITHSLNYWVA